MRIGILTTDTPHHRYFVRELHRHLPPPLCVSFVLFETKPYPWARRARRFCVRNLPNLWKGVVDNPYIQSKRLARSVLSYERTHFFPDGDDALPEGIPLGVVEDVNDSQSAKFLDRHPCEIMFVYGTGLVKPSVYSRAKVLAINAHGGLLPHYRGLDTNLWAALEGRPHDMAVALHVVSEKFDSGDILAQDFIRPAPDLSLTTLRYHTTLLVTSMALSLLTRVLAGLVSAAPQEGHGRYFGPMPHRLKLRAGRIVERWAASAGAVTLERKFGT